MKQKIKKVCIRTILFLFMIQSFQLNSFVQPSYGETIFVDKQQSPFTVTNDVYRMDSLEIIPPERETKKYIIGLKSSTTAQNFMANHINTNRSISSNLDTSTINLFDRKMPEAYKSIPALAVSLTDEEYIQLLADPQIAYIEEDVEVSLVSNQIQTNVIENVYGLKDGSQTIPWGIHSSGAYLTHMEDVSGSRPINVAVFDTGITQHSDLIISGGVSFVENTISYQDNHGHGTHVAGTIAALDNDFGVVGVHPGAQIFAVKVLNAEGKGTYSQLIQGIDWAIANDMDIISMSLGGEEESTALHSAIQQARAHGIIVVAAAGNKGAGEDTVMYPALFDEVLAVGAVNPDHKRAAYSSVGDAVDLVAPGTQILSTTIDGGFGLQSGSSMSAAHVTGALSYLWSKDGTLSGQQVIDKLVSNATELGSNHEFGSGLINLARAREITEDALAPLDIFKTWEPPVYYPPDDTNGSDVSITAYDHVGHHQQIYPGDSATVSLKLSGTPEGANPHDQIRIIVYKSDQPGNILDEEIITNPPLHQPVQYTFYTNSQTALGNYMIEYQYPGTNVLPDKFRIFVIQSTFTDTFEPNDSFGSAYPVIAGGNYESYISGTSDEDYYYFYPQNAGSVAVQLIVPTGRDYDLEIYNQNYQQIAYSKNSVGQSEFAEIPVQAFQGYFIRVYGYSGDFGNAPYHLFISFTEVELPPPPTGLEVNADYNAITVEWNHAQGATNYQLQIEEYDTGVMVDTAVTSSTQHTFTGLKSLTTYTVSIRSSNSAGASAAASITSKTIAPELYVDQPRDFFNTSAMTYLFTPPETGRYTFRTSANSSSAPGTDTVLELRTTSSGVTIMQNDDYEGSRYSEASAILQSSIPYHVRVESYAGSNISARITATSETNSIPFLYLGQPEDINSPDGKDNVFAFMPSITGKYAFYTTYYADSLQSEKNDTLLHVYSQNNLVDTIPDGYNDDATLTSQFSRVEVQLTAGQTYYVKVSGYAGRKVYTRLYAEFLSNIDIATIQNKSTIEVDLDRGTDAYFAFTPTQNGNYRFFTRSQYGANTINDTELYLYANQHFTQLLAYNDDVTGRQPYGALYSKIEHYLTAGQTYYLVAKSYEGWSSRVKVTVEDAFHTTPLTAISANFDKFFGNVDDTNFYQHDISSMYDVDYYRLYVASPGELSVNLSHNSAALEKSDGTTIGYFNHGSASTIKLSEAGTYYLKVHYSERSSDLASLRSPAHFVAYSYAIDPVLVNLQYEAGDGIGVQSTSTLQVLDATPGNHGRVSFSYKPKTTLSNAKLKIYYRTMQGLPGDLVYEKSLGTLNQGQTHTITWNGEFNSINKEYGLRNGNSNYYYARNGFYILQIETTDGGLFGFFKTTKIYGVDTIQVFNDPFSTINLVPMPPERFPTGEYITPSTRDKCQECLNYFHNYAYEPDNVYLYHTQLHDWLQRTYGKTGLESFWESLEYDDNLSPADNLLRFSNNISFIPVIGVAGDSTSAIIYGIRGDYANMGWALVGLVPLPVKEAKVLGGKAYKGIVTGVTPFKRIIVTCNCFAEGTEVQTIDGLVPIEDISPGMLVLSKNTATEEVDYKPVEQVFSYTANQIFQLTIDDETLFVTDDHPFWVVDKGWTLAADLRAGHKLEIADGTFVTVTSNEVHNEPTKVYNFSVAEFHTYYVSNLLILTHNLDCIHFNRYIEAGLTQVNDSVIKAGTQSISRNLQKFVPKPANIDGVQHWEAHHIIPRGNFSNRSKEVQEKLEQIQDILAHNGIDINSPANGMWLPKQPGVNQVNLDDLVVATHNGGHSNDYISYLHEELFDFNNVNNPKAVLEKLQGIREDLLTDTIILGVSK